MRNLIITLLLLVTTAKAQTSSLCKDSLSQPNTFHPCPTDYLPVCGCDNVTYRNDCSAIYWGGLNFQAWQQAPSACGNFHFDFYPTAVTLTPVQFHIFMKTVGSATVYVYDRYGALQFQDLIFNNFPNTIIAREYPLQFLQLGVYFCVVVVNGEKQYLKFVSIGTAN